MVMSKATLIISVYKNTHSLELILPALSIQSQKDFDIIIAEDGTSPQMKEFLQSAGNIVSNKITHITQEDKGFRTNRILTEAIRTAETGYLIFIDGDCIPHPDLINEHMENPEQNTDLCGRRVALGKKPSEELTNENIMSK